MKRTAILVAALLLLPIAAGAQVPGARVPTAAAQTTNGIMVSAGGATRIPATSATIILQLSSTNRTLLDKTKLQPLVDALVKAGVDPANIRFPFTLDVPGGATNNFALTVLVPHPSATIMQNGIMTVGTTIASMKDVLILNAAQVMLTAGHCQDAFDVARHQAIVRARAKAESIAKDLNVHAGAAISANSMEMSYSDGTCRSQYYINPTGLNGDPSAPQTAQDYMTVPVNADITITYAIK